jgi:hypothetical protein
MTAKVATDKQLRRQSSYMARSMDKAKAKNVAKRKAKEEARQAEATELQSGPSK